MSWLVDRNLGAMGRDPTRRTAPVAGEMKFLFEEPLRIFCFLSLDLPNNLYQIDKIKLIRIRINSKATGKVQI